MIPPKIVLAGTYEQFRRWCRDNDLDHRKQVCVTSESDIPKILGLRFSAADVVYAGTWGELPASLRALVQQRAMP